tara:strand:+ start:333 stop:536 length:204 start_codon:yes stop_codon:yes gene_type:complete
VIVEDTVTVFLIYDALLCLECYSVLPDRFVVTDPKRECYEKPVGQKPRREGGTDTECYKATDKDTPR